MRYSFAIFDVCGTLYRSNTTFDFLEFYWREKNDRVLRLFFTLSGTMLGKAVWVILSNVYDRDLFRRLAVRTLFGERINDVDDAAKRFVKIVLSSKARSEVLHILDIQRSEGAEIVLLSASLCPVVRAIASELKIERYYCSSLEVKDDRFSGYFLDDVRGRKKEIFLKEISDSVEFVFVTDNKEDLSLLEYSSSPYVVVRRKHKKFWKVNKPAHANLLEVE